MKTKNISSVLIILFCAFSFTNVIGQTINADKESFKIDTKNKLIIWHVKNLNTEFEEDVNITKVSFSEELFLNVENVKLDYKTPYKLNTKDSIYSLYITKLPLISIALNEDTLNSENKFPGYFTYYDDSVSLKSIMGIRQRGNLSLTFPKKSYDIEFWNDTIKKTSKDLKFGNLRNDDDWILDGLYNEPLKVRAQVATELWEDIHKPYYLAEEPKAKSSFRSKYVEIFVNDTYNGLFALTESVDRKQLKLKKNKASLVRGELFKANSYDGGPDFKKAGKFNNYFPHYVGFRMEYPVIDYNSYWDNLAVVLDLVVNQSNDDFSNNIANKIHIDNAIDYYLFINAIGAGDNFGKNYYLAKYTINEPYFFVPWDLDSSFGLVQNAQKLTITNRTLSNNLFDRLIAVNPNNYNARLKKRWEELRASTLSNNGVLNRFNKIFEDFTASKIYEREAIIWPKATTNKADNAYLQEWITAKLSYLDTYINGL